MLKRALLTVVALLVFAGPAQAEIVSSDGQPLSQDWQDAALAAERAFPQATINCPTVTVVFTEDGRELVPGSWHMWARQQDCLIGALPRYRIASLAKLCPSVVHEYGHLAGLEHTDNPNDIMNRFGLTPWPKECGPDIQGRLRRIDNWLRESGRNSVLAWCASEYEGSATRKRCYRREGRRYDRVRARLLGERAVLQQQLR